MIKPPLPWKLIHLHLSKQIEQSWKLQLLNSISNTTLGTFKHHLLSQPWTRSTDRALDISHFRLRTGHTRLRSHLFRLNLSSDPFCTYCTDQEETVAHVLLHCSKYQPDRQNFIHSLSRKKHPYFEPSYHSWSLCLKSR